MVDWLGKSGEEISSRRRPKRSPLRTFLRWGVRLFVALIALSLLSSLLGPKLERHMPHFGKKRIGVVELTGLIADSKTFNEDLQAFVDDESIGAIVVRINSPGGVIAPSQEIYEEILKARDKKKIVASMSTVAASGGYYVAAAADHIIANPGTITGSIGVLMKFINYEDLQRWAKLKSFTLKSGAFKDMGSPTRNMTPAEERVFQSMIVEMKEQFVGDIAKARNMDVEKVRELADGRIFSGAEAQRLGLVDEIGNLEDAVAKAGALAGIPGEAQTVYPPQPHPKLIDYLLGVSTEHATQIAARAFGEALADRLGLMHDQGGVPFLIYAVP